MESVTKVSKQVLKKQLLQEIYLEVSKIHQGKVCGDESTKRSYQT
ncbi:hypothetical protein [Halalkalibacterium ligniniphilum]|nr:hypothetical protein [Halalkalibacterium ligniniphilum]